MTFANYGKAQSEMASIQEAYLALLEKRRKEHDDKVSESDVEKVARELEKVADELKEELMEGVLDFLKKGSSTSILAPGKVAELHKKAAEYKASMSAEDISMMHELLMKGRDEKAKEAIRKAGGPSPDPAASKKLHESLEAALIEALTDTDFEGKAKVASTSADANLLAALAQSHMSENVAGAVDICNHVARNPNTPKHVLEQLAKHPNPKVVESASNNLTSKDSQMNESLTESYNNGRSKLDDDYVARQFAAGKPAERKSAKTDGKIYWLHGNEIARQHGEPGKMEFNWAGWYTPTTERHLNTILHQVAPGKSVQKTQHKNQGIERFTLDHFKAPDPGADAQPNPHDGKDK